MNTAISASNPLSYHDALMRFRQDDKAKQHYAEAEFGHTYVASVIHDLPKGIKILEVGSGSGLLLSRLAQEFPEKSFTGLEPMGDGFTYKPVMHKFAQSLPNADIRPIGFEDLPLGETFDLIFLVNVFEHLPDWEAFLNMVKTVLTPTGQCIILCPNYSFPYEPHFRLPILINKPVTHAVFRKNINDYETREDSHGLWKSLNFVKLRHVKSKAALLGLHIDARKDILADMILRLESDPEFGKRQSVLKFPIMLAKTLGLIKLIIGTTLFDNWLPYMHLVVRHADALNGGESWDKK